MSLPPRRAITRVAIAVLIVMSGLAGGAGEGRAQALKAEAGAPAALPEPLTREALRDLLARLSDAQVRELLIAQLDKEISTAPAAPNDHGYIHELESAATTLRESWSRMYAAVPALPTVPLFLAERLQDGRPPSILPLLLFFYVVIFAVGGALEWVYRRFTTNLRRQMAEAEPQSPSSRIVYAMLRIGLDLLGIAIFTAGAIGTFFVFYQGHVPVRRTVMMLIGAVVVTRLVALVSRFLLAPNAPSLRLLPMDDRAAAFLHRRIVWLAAVAAGGLMTVDLLVLLGIDPDLAHLLRTVVGAVLVAMLIALIWHVREPVARLIRGAPADVPGTASMAQRLRGLLAAMWPGFALLYVLVLWAMSEITKVLDYKLAAHAGVWSLVLIIAVPLIDAAIGHGIRAYAEARHGVAGDEADAYGRVARRAARILLIVAAVAIFARVWGISVFDFERGGIAERMASTLVDVGLTLLVAYVGWEIAKTAIDRRLALEEGPAGPSEVGGEGGGKGGSRLKTLLPLFRKFLMITLAVMVTMLVLSSLGVDIGPLLAGAGVIGLAIGFGAQTLVKDIISGMFFLLDDAFRVGEYIESGSIRGTVEHISIRSLRLRHHRGALHTIPFGTLDQITNYSRDWVIDKMTVSVTYGTDLDKVKRVVKEVSKQIMADPELAPNLIEPLKMQGVEQFGDFAIQIRLKMMTQPGEQFVIRRRAYAMIKKAFDANGIEFAFPTVTVAGGGEERAAVAQKGLELVQPPAPAT
jgi:small-conductance mechanosensitive channel